MDLNHGSSLLEAENLYEQGRYEESFRLYKSLADDGVVSCQAFLGWMYYEGTGVEKNLEKAFSWSIKAANTGSPNAQFYLAKIYAKEGDFDNSFVWYKRAADKHYAPALFKLANMYLLGIGVNKNNNVGLKLLEQAARKGHLFAKKQFAVEIMKGKKGFLYVPYGLYLFFSLLFLGIWIAWRDIKDDRVIT